MKVTIKVLESGYAFVKVESKGRIYACQYADSDTKMACDLTEQDIKKDWKQSRRSFLPYDEVMGHYV